MAQSRSSRLQDLIRRRVPQIVGLYLAVGWGVLEFIGWLTDRYALTPRLADIGLAAIVVMIPSVIIFSYFHGEPGRQGWTLVEKVGLPLNLLAAAIVLTLVAMRPPDVGGADRIEAAAAPALDATRIGVLYFADESENQDQGHLASAFTGALIDELTQVNALTVAPRTAVRPFQGTAVSLDSIARALRAGTLVEGSVSGGRDRLSVSVTLIDPRTRANIEGFRLEGTVAEWSDLRGELAREVARRLRQRLGAEIVIRERKATGGSAATVTLVERAERLRDEADRLELAGDTAAVVRALQRADSLLARAEELDPDWVEPVVLRGHVARQRGGFASAVQGTLVQEEVLRGLYHAERALEIDPTDPGALELRGALRFEISQSPSLAQPAPLRDAAEQDLQAAVTADPWRAVAWATLSQLHRLEGQFAEALGDAERALEADPFLAEADAVTWSLLESSLELKDMEGALRWCGEGRRRFRDDHSWWSCALFLPALSEGPEPDVARAWALADTILQLAPPQQRAQLQPIGDTWVAAVLARAGLPDSAASVARRAQANAPSGLEAWIDYYVANVRLLMGQRQEALALLERFLSAIPQRRGYIARDWMFQDLHDDPRFQALVREGEASPVDER